MTRSAIKDSKVYFDSLDKYCTDRGVDVLNFGKVRFLKADNKSVKCYAKSKIEDFIRINGAKSFFDVIFEDRRYIITYGAENDIQLSIAEYVDFSPGDLMLACLCGDLTPSAIPEIVSDFLGSGEQEMSGYAGHDFDAALQNYRRFQKHLIDQDVDVSFEKICFEIALDDIKKTSGWMQDILIKDLKSLSDLDINLPYKNILRSLYDIDPASLYLSLYRCIEATYAFKVCIDLVNTFEKKMSWIEMYEILDGKARWKPKEFDSLEAVLRMGSPQDHEYILEATGNVGSPGSKKSADIIYDIRNRLVHFRPYQNIDDIYLSYDWNLLCRALVGHICFIYAEIRSNA